MPNHVTNRIEIFGEKSEIDRLLEAVKNDEFGLGTIDFNKIIPMPEGLEIECGSRTDRGLKAYREFMDIVGMLDSKVVEKTKKAFLSQRKDISEEDFKLGGQAYENIKKCGYSTWYDWCIANWGTKWNSYGYCEGSDYTVNEGEIPEIRFLTAWSAPHPILEKLSEMFPAVKISHEWADEDIGYNCGRREYYGGERSEEYYPDYEKESIEFAARVMDVQLEEDLGLYLNASETGYINIEGDDEYERIELFGKSALFTNDRITDADIPNGMYCYHIRHGDDGNFYALEKCVAVNHAGSVVTKEPIDLGKTGFIAFTEDNFPDFSGETMSLYMFREYDGEQTEDEDMGMEMKQ